MRMLSLPRRARPLFWSFVAFFLLLMAGTAASISYQRHLLKEKMSEHLEHELHLLGVVVQTALLTRHESNLQGYLDVFSRDHEEIARARVTTPDGRVLASFERPADEAHLLRTAGTVSFDGGRQVTFELAHDLRPEQAQFRLLALNFGAASMVFMAVMGLVLWRILRATAFRPLEQAVEELERTKENLELRVAERTADWMMANKELKIEIAERLAVEQQLAIKDWAIASSISGIALAGFDGRLTYVNEAFLRLWGHDRPEEVIGRQVTEFWQSPEDAAEVMRALRTGGTWFGERTALRSSEQRLRSVTDNVSDVIYRRRPDGTITYASPSVRAVLGYAPEEVVGMNFRDFAHPGDLERAVATDRRLRNGLPVKDQSLRVFRKTGETIDVEVTLVPIMNEAGLFEVQGILRDVSERKATEAALGASEARLRLILENINEIVYQVVIDDARDPAHAAVEFVSGQVENIVGYPAGRFLEDPHLWLSLIHREDLPAIAESARRLLAGAASDTRTYRVRHGRTGELIWLEDKVVPRLDGQGTVIGYFGVTRDITKRKQTEDELTTALVRAQEEQNKSSAILAAMGDAVSIQDRDFKVLYQNEVHKQLIGSHVGEFCYEAYYYSER